MTTRRAALAATVGAVALLAACGTATRGPVAQTTPGRATTCTGEWQRGTTLGHLPADARVVGALLCWQDSRVLPGGGEWRVRVQVRADGELARQLDRALHEPDAPAHDGTCPAFAYLPPDLQVDLADGTTARPALPRDACALPRPHVAAVLDRLRADPGATVVPLTEQRTAAAVRAGCAERWKDVLTGPFHPDGAGPPLPPLPADATVGVCVYEQRDGALALVRSGRTTARAVGPLAVTARPATPCPAAVLGAVGLHLGALGAASFLLVETGGCGRVVDAGGRAVGYLPGSVVTRLAALATTPEPGA
ncbi:MAG TPA: hypothetical protein VFS29_01545 [Motilibacteraceae bacterium]|nr:hypothetical protein [Motilibacteraceae bacterium]